MIKFCTWSELLDDLFKMKIESDKGVPEKPLLAPFIKKAQYQQFSLALENPKPSNLEVLFGYCVANLTLVRREQIRREDIGTFADASLLDPPMTNALNMTFDLLEVLAREEITKK